MSEPVRDKLGYVRTAFVEMNLKQQKKLLPPREKVERIFFEHCVKGRTQRDVAAEFGVTHQYVGKCKAKVAKYLGVTVGRAGTGDWVQRKGVVDHVYRERLSHMFGECLEGLKASCGKVTTRKITYVDKKPVKQEVCERETQRNWRWADLALKAADMRADFEYKSGACEPPEEAATDEDNKEWVQKTFSEAVYMDRAPTEQELADARTVHSRLEEERKLLAEARRKLESELAVVEKLKRDLEASLAEVHATVGRASQPVALAVQEDGAVQQDATTSQVEKNATGLEARPTFTWRHAQPEDFNMSIVRNRELRRIREERERTGVVNYEIRTVGLPLKIRKGVFIVALPFPNTKQLEESYRAEYLRQEEEAKKEGKPWRDPFYMFDNFGQLLKKEE